MTRSWETDVDMSLITESKACTDALTLVRDNRMFLSKTLCWFDVRLLGQTHRRTDDQHEATGGEGPRPQPWRNHSYNHIQSSIRSSGNTCWNGGKCKHMTCKNQTPRTKTNRSSERYLQSKLSLCIRFWKSINIKQYLTLLHTLTCSVCACPSI